MCWAKVPCGGHCSPRFPFLVIIAQASWHKVTACFFDQSAVPKILFRFCNTSTKDIPFSMLGVFPIIFKLRGTQTPLLCASYTDQGCASVSKLQQRRDSNPPNTERDSNPLQYLHQICSANFNTHPSMPPTSEIPSNATQCWLLDVWR